MLKLEYKIKIISDNNLNLLSNLAKESIKEGYGFVNKTIHEWNSGINRFSKKGEVLYGVFHNDNCVAFGGLNNDPYLDKSSVGRVRHIYVSKGYRHKGIANELLIIIANKAKENFDVLRLSTNNSAAASLYEKFGFKKTDGHKQTHIIYDINNFTFMS